VKTVGILIHYNPLIIIYNHYINLKINQPDKLLNLNE